MTPVKHRHFRWGLYGALAVLFALAIALFVQLAFAYDGKCGGLMPFLAGPAPCSFWEHFSGWALLTALLLLTHWPLVLALLFVPAAIGHLLDRRMRKRVV